MSERFPISQRTRATVRKFRLRSHEFDFFNYATVDTVKYETDFLGDTIDATLATGGAGTAAALQSGDAGGTVDLVTGGVDNQCSILYLPDLNFTADMNPVLAVRLYVSSIASGNVQIGWSSSAAAGVLGATGIGTIVSPLAATPTLNTATDTVVATYDLSSALTNPSYWRMAGARNSTAWLVTPTTTDSALRAPTASTYQWIVLRLCRSERGATDQSDAYLEINGVEVAHQGDGAITNTTAITPFVLIGATSATSRTLTLDYLGVWADRDINA